MSREVNAFHGLLNIFQNAFREFFETLVSLIEQVQKIKFILFSWWLPRMEMGRLDFQEAASKGIR